MSTHRYFHMRSQLWPLRTFQLLAWTVLCCTLLAPMSVAHAQVPVADRPPVPYNQKRTHEVQVCAAELAAAQFLAIKKSENNPRLCPISNIQFTSRSLECELLPMTSCQYRGWICSIEYRCSKPHQSVSNTKFRKWKYKDQRLPSYFKTKAVTQSPENASSQSGDCNPLARRAKLCLPFSCLLESKIWNIKHAARYQIHGRNGQNICRISHYKQKDTVSTLHSCRFPVQQLDAVAKYFEQTTGPENQKGVSHQLSGGRMVAVVDGSTVIDPTANSEHCEKYFIYHNDGVCHKIISGSKGNFEPVDCALLKQQYPFLQTK